MGWGDEKEERTEMRSESKVHFQTLLFVVLFLDLLFASSFRSHGDTVLLFSPLIKSI